MSGLFNPAHLKMGRAVEGSLSRYASTMLRMVPLTASGEELYA